MSYCGQFTNDDEDIVTLGKSFPEQQAIAGWVNVGTHAIYIQLDAEGGLSVEVKARCNEGDAIKSLAVSKQESLCHGGVNPDD